MAWTKFWLSRCRIVFNIVLYYFTVIYRQYIVYNDVPYAMSTSTVEPELHGTDFASFAGAAVHSLCEPQPGMFNKHMQW